MGGHHYQPTRSSGERKFAEEHLIGQTEDNSTYRDTYSECVSTKVEENWSEDGTIEEKWSVIWWAMVEAATEVLGHKKKH